MNPPQHGSASWSSSTRCSYWGRWKRVGKEDPGLRTHMANCTVTTEDAKGANLEVRGRCEGKMEPSLSEDVRETETSLLSTFLPSSWKSLQISLIMCHSQHSTMRSATISLFLPLFNTEFFPLSHCQSLSALELKTRSLGLLQINDQEQCLYTFLICNYASVYICFLHLFSHYHLAGKYEFHFMRKCELSMSCFSKLGSPSFP